MTQDEIIRMAREAGFTDYYPERLTRFAALVRAEALEEAAKWLKESGLIGSNDCAAAIRSLKDSA